jgi:hypothetical protein
MENLSTKVLGKIKQEKIIPIEKWKINLANDFFWAGFAVVGGLTGLSLSASFHLLHQADWQVPYQAKIGSISYILSVLPYFWIILLLFFIFLSYINLRHTKMGYRYEKKKIVITIVVVALSAGSLIYITKAQEKVDEAFFVHVPFYINLANSREKVWTQPEKGLLAGMIIVVSDDALSVQDFEGRNWKVVEVNHALISPRVQMEEEELIKVIGDQEDEQVFRAEEIRPWGGKGRFREREIPSGGRPAKKAEPKED